MSKRGVVVSCPFEYADRSLHIISSELDPVELRRWVLYWDTIDWPVNNLIHIESRDSEVRLLMDEGVLERTSVRVTGSGDLAMGFLGAQITAFRNRAAEDPGAWTMSQPGSQLILPEGEDAKGPIAELDLLRVLPTPMPDTSIDSILEFKRKREEELLELRGALDKLYLAILDSRDTERAAVSAKHEVERGVRQLDRVLSESQISRFMSSVKVEFDLAKLVGGLTVGGATGTVFGVPLAIGAATGAVVSALSLKVTAGPRLSGLPDSVRAFAYLGHAKKDLGAR